MFKLTNNGLDVRGGHCFFTLEALVNFWGIIGKEKLSVFGHAGGAAVDKIIFLVCQLCNILILLIWFNSENWIKVNNISIDLSSFHNYWEHLPVLDYFAAREAVTLVVKKFNLIGARDQRCELLESLCFRNFD